LRVNGRPLNQVEPKMLQDKLQEPILLLGKVSVCTLFQNKNRCICCDDSFIPNMSFMKSYHTLICLVCSHYKLIQIKSSL